MKNKKRKTAITVGGASVDSYIFTNPEIIWKKKKEMIVYPLGSKIYISKTYLTTGGGGTNSAASFNKLGFNATYLGRIGDDFYGSFVLKELKKKGIKFMGLKKGQTAFSLILDVLGHDRTIFVFKGDENNLLYSHLTKTALKAEIFYIATILGKTLETVKKIVNRNKENFSLIAFNTSEYMIKQYRQDVLWLSKKSDIVIMNREEAILLNKEEATIEELFLNLIKKIGEKIIGITDGPQGVYIYNDGYVYYLNARDMKVIDSTGAGDCFSSTFSAFVSQGYDIATSMKAGIINSESVIRKVGAKEGLIQSKELIKKIRTDKRKVKKWKI